MIDPNKKKSVQLNFTNAYLHSISWFILKIKWEILGMYKNYNFDKFKAGVVEWCHKIRAFFVQ